MNICYITPVLFPLNGGVQLVIYNQAKRLISDGHRVVIITNHRNLDERFEKILSQKRQEIEGIIIYETYLGTSEWLQGEVFSTLLEVDKKHSINVYIGHLSPTEELYPFIKNVLKKKVVHYQHGWNFLATTLKVEYADAVIVPSSNVLELVTSGGYYVRHSWHSHQYHLPRKAWQGEIYVLPNGFDETIFKFREIYDVNPDKKKILFVGRLSKLKGISELFDAMKEVAKKFDVELLTIGPIQIEEIPEFPWHKHIDYTNEVEKYMRDADLFVLPSHDEGFPLTILEAVGTGVPIVATPVGNIPQILALGVGLMTPVGEVSTLVRTIIQLLTDKELYKSCVEKCGIYRNNYTWKGNVLRLEHILNLILNGDAETRKKFAKDSWNWG